MRDRWDDLARRAGCRELAARFDELDALYRERHRAYHDWTHIRECLDVWDRSGLGAESPVELELALFLHDAVYRPLRSDNEARSADLAMEWLTACPGAASPEVVHGLIMATRHPAPPETPDQAVIQDIDLHILGAARTRFDEYEDQVRREYRIVPGPLFRSKRAEILASFLEGGPIYHSDWFQMEFEERARENLRRALERLRGSGDA